MIENKGALLTFQKLTSSPMSDELNTFDEDQILVAKKNNAYGVSKLKFIKFLSFFDE